MPRRKPTEPPDLTPSPAPPPSVPEPPGHLSDRSRALWLDVAGSRVKATPRLALLQTALESLDRADAAREKIAAEGMVTVTKGTGVAHLSPLVRAERDA